MKKVIFLVFAIILSVILNQLLLGSNGLIEGYKLRKEMEALQNYMEYLKDEKSNLEEYVAYLKSSDTHESAKEELANNLGFFDNNKKVLFRIRDNASKRVSLNIGEISSYSFGIASTILSSSQAQLPTKLYVESSVGCR